LTDDPPRLTDDPLALPDDPSRLTDDSSRLTDDPSALTDDPSRLTGNPSRLADDRLRLADHPSALTDDRLRLVDHPSALTDDPLRLTAYPSELTDDPLRLAGNPSVLTDDWLRLTDDPPRLTDDRWPGWRESSLTIETGTDGGASGTSPSALHSSAEIRVLRISAMGRSLRGSARDGLVRPLTQDVRCPLRLRGEAQGLESSYLSRILVTQGVPEVPVLLQAQPKVGRHAENSG